MAIARAAKSPYFERFIAFLGIRLIPNRSLAIRERDGEQLSQWLLALREEHAAIVDAIAAGDQRAAREAARRHLVNSIDRHAVLQGAQRRPGSPPRQS